MKPLIGVTQYKDQADNFYKVSESNMQAVERAGGIPVVLSYLSNDEDLEQLAHQLDGLYLTGGDDIDPIYFDEEPHQELGSFNPDRDRFEMKLTRIMLEKDKPVFAVCRGAQVLNVALGGNMYQDLPAQLGGTLYQHLQKTPVDIPVHGVDVTEGSLLYKLTGKKKIRVNSYHHQANKQLGEGLIISGKAGDGVIEAIEGTRNVFVLGVQWHPERLAEDPITLQLYKGFIEACKNQ